MLLDRSYKYCFCHSILKPKMEIKHKKLKARIYYYIMLIFEGSKLLMLKIFVIHT